MGTVLKVSLSKSVRKTYLFSLLEECFDVQFVEDSGFIEKDFGASIFHRQDLESPRRAALKRHTYVICANDGPRPSSDTIRARISFSDSVLAPWSFRNRTVDNILGNPYGPVDGQARFEAVASIENVCTWAIGKVDGHIHYEVGTMLPPIPERGPLFKWFNGGCFMEMLPLIDFLRHISGIGAYSRPRPAACIMFDDPNLHSTKYGFIDFGKLARHARRYNYHAAFATVPLDLYYADRGALGLFRSAPERLSLLIHGNNHVANELGYDYDDEKRLAIILQALSRVERFEKRYGLPISRVMAAPHGVCTESMFKDMARCGLESGCVSFGSLFKTNRERAWVDTMGTGPSTDIAGLPVLNRIALNNPNAAFLAAYLGQPIIPNGHGGDLKEGLDVLGDIAGAINSLGDVQWGSMQDLSRSGYLMKTGGETLHIGSISRLIDLRVPVGIRSIRLEMSEFLDGQGPHGPRCSVNGRVFRDMGAERTIPVNPGDDVSVALPSDHPVERSQVALLRTPVGAILRRLATEARDRLQPYPHRLRKFLGGSREGPAGS
jgi:hypothetical protein